MKPRRERVGKEGTEGGDVDVDVVKTWTENILPSTLEKYSEEDVYNADETGLFWSHATK